jgi:hypothetical protein
MFIAETVAESATPELDEILVIGLDENGKLMNVLLKNQTALRTKLLETPRMILNPARDSLEQAVFELAVNQHMDETKERAVIEAANAIAITELQAPLNSE